MFSTDSLISALGEQTKYILLVSYILFIPLSYLIYLFLALFIHRRDRRELEAKALSLGIDITFIYSWRGVELRITHPAKKDSGPNGGPPASPPL